METPKTTPCPRCDGKGKRNGQTCDLCGGSGEIEVEIEPESCIPAGPSPGVDLPGPEGNGHILHPEQTSAILVRLPPLRLSTSI